MFARASTPGVTQERRSSPRQTVAYRLDVLTRSGQVGCLLDISGTGMRVLFRRALEVAGIVELTVEFPRWLELGKGLTLPGRFVWVRTEPEGGIEGGYAFEELPRKDRAALESLIARLAETVARDRGNSA
jgi:hypothetical protein